VLHDLPEISLIFYTGVQSGQRRHRSAEGVRDNGTPLLVVAPLAFGAFLIAFLIPRREDSG
jgi:hypothetical protein